MQGSGITCHSSRWTITTGFSLNDELARGISNVHSRCVVRGAWCVRTNESQYPLVRRRKGLCAPSVPSGLFLPVCVFFAKRVDASGWQQTQRRRSTAIKRQTPQKSGTVPSQFVVDLTAQDLLSKNTFGTHSTAIIVAEPIPVIPESGDVDD